MKKRKHDEDEENPDSEKTAKETAGYETNHTLELDGLSKQKLYKQIKALRKAENLSAAPGKESYLEHELQAHQIELEMQNRELRETQQELELIRDRYADLYDFAPVSYVTFNEKGVVKNINLTGASLLGAVRSNILGKPFLRWLIKDDIEIYYRHLQDTLFTGRKTDEVRLKDKSGKCLDVRIESIRSWDKEGTQFLCQSAILNITENKRAQNEITLKARQLKLITDALPVLIAYLNCSEQHLFANKAYMNGFRISVEGFKERNAREIWGEKVYSTIMPQLEIAYMGQQVNFDMDLLLAGVKKKYVNIIIEPDFDVNSVVQGVIIVIGDITERLTNEGVNRERLLNAANFARQSNMGELASEIAHELNQPLAAIAIYSDTCRRLIESGKASNTEVIQILSDISDQTVRAGEVIRHIREFVSKKELQLSKVDLNDMAEEVVELLKVELRSHHVELTVNLVSPLPEIMADKILIEQVILNFSRNAIEAMDVLDKNRRMLKIETFLAGSEEVEFRVEDAGPGMTPEEMKRIFEPFHTTKKNGMGLGLAISKSIIDAHYGHIWGVSNDQGGSVFCFTLPVIIEE